LSRESLAIFIIYRLVMGALVLVLVATNAIN
jgi:undecaprenyl pyrophosphate phosphatase UppP